MHKTIFTHIYCTCIKQSMSPSELEVGTVKLLIQGSKHQPAPSGFEPDVRVTSKASGLLGENEVNSHMVDLCYSRVWRSHGKSAISNGIERCWHMFDRTRRTS